MKLLYLLILSCNFAIFLVDAGCVKRSPQKELITTKVYESCVTTDQRRGRCIPLATCKIMSDIFFKEPLCKRELDYLKRNQCGLKYGIIMICCPYVIRRTKSPPPKPTKSPEMLLPPPGVCGPGVHDRVVGGKVAGIDEYPWMALVMYTKHNVSLGPACGGFLINNYFVLTAAHCVHHKDLPANISATSVRLGEWDLNSKDDCDEDDCSDPPVNIPIQRYIIHENYHPPNKVHDIALLKLQTSVTYTDWIKPLCLPLALHLRGDPIAGTIMQAAGWGRKDDGRKSRVLLKVQLPVVGFDKCGQIFEDLETTQMCAGGKVVDTCGGDSGGPLMARDTTNKTRMYFYAAGIVSFGDRDCGKGRPAVYTKVSAYIDWILKNIDE